MLHRITSTLDPLCSIIQDDPVRPEIPLDFRVSPTANIFVLLDDYSKPTAAVCVAYKDSVPHSVLQLAQPNLLTATVAVFYTIWSYQAGAARQLIRAVQQWLQSNNPQLTTFVTLSPPTDMARVFHLRNGADVLSVNSDTINYIYTSNT
jgi:hypothetical protein